MPDRTLHFKQADRDLLVEIKAKLERAIDDIKDLKENTSGRVEILENEKLDKSELFRHENKDETLHKDVEMRLRRLERYGSIAIGFLMLLEFSFKFFVK